MWRMIFTLRQSNCVTPSVNCVLVSGGDPKEESTKFGEYASSAINMFALNVYQKILKLTKTFFASVVRGTSTEKMFSMFLSVWKNRSILHCHCRLIFTCLMLKIAYKTSQWFCLCVFSGISVGKFIVRHPFYILSSDPLCPAYFEMEIDSVYQTLRPLQRLKREVEGCGCLDVEVRTRGALFRPLPWLWL